MAKQYSEPHPFSLELDKSYSATLHTNNGDISIALDAERSPTTVNNFVALARDGFYDGVIFHRVISGFMIQGGDPTGTGRGGPGWRFADEFHPSLSHTGKGILSMANAGPGTNGSQFFVCQVKCPWLDGKHAVFGKVVENSDLIDTIAGVPKGPGDRPRTDVVLHQIEVFRR